MKPEIVLIRAGGKDDGSMSVPWGIISLASFLKKYGYRVKLFDRMSVGRFFNKVAKDALRKEAAYVGISALTTQARDAEFLGKYFKSRGKTVLLGGLHYTISPDEGSKFADHIFRGEGEKSLLNFLENKPESGVIESEPLSDLDDIPLPTKELFDGMYMNRNYFNIITSRGCPYNCSFCLDKKYKFNKLRYHSAGYVLDLLEMLNKTFGLESFFIADDIFTVNRDRALEICAGIKKRALRISLGAFTHAGIDDLEMYKEFKSAGFTSLSIGVESGSDEVLKAMDKQQTVAQAINTVEIIKKAGLKVSSTFMAGNALETEGSLKATLELAKALGVTGWVSYAQPFPGTKLSETALQYGKMIEPDPRKFWNNKIVFLPDGLSKSKLKYYRDKIAIALKAPVSLSAKILNKFY